MTTGTKVRFLVEKDYEQVFEIYNYYVMNSTFTGESGPCLFDDYKVRLRNISCEFPFLVAQIEDAIVGYCHANKYRITSGNKWNVESTVYVSPDYTGDGLAKRLYAKLFSVLSNQNYFNVYASIILPNDASVRLHESIGFSNVGVFKNSIFKFGKWYDVKWMERKLAEHILAPPKIKSLAELYTEKPTT